jgi:hypothetical protein
MSPNDPYFDTEWAGKHQTVSLNTNHPFWSVRLNSDGDRAIYCMIAAIDAYVLWKIAQLHEPPDASETQKMRDYALRFCTLTDTELLTSD